MNTAINAPFAASEAPARRWLADLVSGLRWGLEMHRRYESERAAGRPVDEEALRRITGEVDAWLGRRT